MAKGGKERRGNMLMDFNDDAELPMCSPLPDTPGSSPKPKKTRESSRDEDEDEVSNADILKAIQDLASRFIALEQRISKITSGVVAVNEHVEGIEHVTKTTNDMMHVTNQNKNIEETERSSRRWNLKLLNLPESLSEAAEDVRTEVLNIFGQIAPEEKDKLDFLIDAVHRVGRPRDDGSPRPVIIQFTVRTFRQKIWRASANAAAMKEKKLRLAQDLTYGKRRCRKKLWPLVDNARKDGKRTTWRGPGAISDGKKSDLYPKNDPDWVPSVRMTGTSRYKPHGNKTQKILKDADDPGTLIKEMMTQQSQEAKQTDREPEEKLEIKALFQTKRIPANVLCGESSDGLKLQDHLHIKKEEEELWESVEEKQETDITAVTVKSEDEEEEAQCSLLHWRQSEENIKGEPATCSSAKLLKVEPNGDISEGPEAANTWTQQDTDGEETDCSDTEDSEDWREPLSQSEAQSEHMDMSWDSTHTSDHHATATTHSTQKPHGCDVCGKLFSSRIDLKRHKRTHTVKKPFSCDFCEKRFSSQSNLNRHHRIHTGQKPFSCGVCGKRFGRNESLKRHMIVHSRQKTYKCEICGNSFSNQTHLKIHTVIHTGEKPFSCDVCGKTFGRNESLKRHMSVHSGEKPYGCDV